MLPSQHRLRSSSDIRAACKGATAGSESVVVHVRPRSERLAAVPGPRIAVVCSKKTGNSVVRHTMARRLRHVVAEIVGEIPAQLDVVIRARPSITQTSPENLRDEVSRTLRRALVKEARNSGGPGRRSSRAPGDLTFGASEGRSSRAPGDRISGDPGERNSGVARGRTSAGPATGSGGERVCAGSAEGGKLVGVTLYARTRATDVSRETSARG